MKYIKGQNRNHLVIFPTSLDNVIEKYNDVRFIDLFVESLDVSSVGFKIDHIENGHLVYYPKDLFKLSQFKQLVFS